MDDDPNISTWGSLALVSYLPNPLGSFLNGLRHSLTGEPAPDAHVTILPRRPLAMPVDAASEQIQQILAGFHSFTVELSSLRLFHQTNVLYLDIGEGSARLHALHDALSLGALAHEEEFEFRPHLTLGCPIPSSKGEDLRKTAKAAWESLLLNRGFLLQEVVCLWMPPAGSQSQWSRLWSHTLKPAFAITTTVAATTQTY